MHVTRDPCSNYKAFIWGIFVKSSSGSKSQGQLAVIGADEQLVIQWICGATALDIAL